MSSIMRRRSGLTASADLVEVMGGSGLEVGVLDTLDPQASLPARHLTPSSIDAVYSPNPPLRAKRVPAVAGSLSGRTLPGRPRPDTSGVGGEAVMLLGRPHSSVWPPPTFVSPKRIAGLKR